MEQLDRIEAKLDQLLGGKPPVNVPAYEIPELRLSAIDPATIDGHTVQADGSVWARAIGPDGTESGSPYQLVYGFISEAKDPALWDRMAALQTGGATELQRIIDANGKHARYKTHPAAIVHMGNFVLLGYLLSNPIREQG